MKVSLATLAINKDPMKIKGRNILSKADNYDAVKSQGLNAEFYALILNSYGKYGFKNSRGRRYQAQPCQENSPPVFNDPLRREHERLRNRSESGWQILPVVIILRKSRTGFSVIR